MCNIRQAIDADIPAIMQIWEEAVRATHTFLRDDEIEFYKERGSEYLSAVDLFVYDDGRIKGFSGIADRKLEMLFVSERGTGIGSKLLADAIEKGITKVDVNEENPPAAEFYFAKGFRQESRSETDSEGNPHPILHLTLGQ